LSVAGVQLAKSFRHEYADLLSPPKSRPRGLNFRE
jgi:hypothetical protein